MKVKPELNKIHPAPIAEKKSKNVQVSSKMKTIHHKLRCATTLVYALITITLALSGTAQGGSEGSKIAPPNSNAYGQSLAEWLKQYTAWIFGGAQTPQLFGHVLFPVVGGTVTGSGTLADPLIITGHGDFTFKAGTAFFTPLLYIAGESYEDGSFDPPFPDAWWGTYLTFAENVVLDGQTVITEAEIGKYYVPPQNFNPPLLYPEPTSYGAVGIHAVQGSALFCKPLAVGAHQISWVSSIMLPADNGLGPVEFGEIVRLSHTITVVP
jgi:hypothetical protein